MYQVISKLKRIVLRQNNKLCHIVLLICKYKYEFITKTNRSFLILRLN